MFTKVFAQIFDSSLADDYVTRHVFMDLLVLADAEGCVDKTAHAISRQTNVPLSVVRKAICKLCKPDPWSRTKDEDGRRLVLLDERRDWGWQIVNYKRYRNMRDESARREYMRTYMRRRREEQAKRKQDVNFVNIREPQLAHTEAEAVLSLYGADPCKLSVKQRRTAEAGLERLKRAGVPQAFVLDEIAKHQKGEAPWKELDGILRRWTQLDADRRATWTKGSTRD